MTAVGIQTARLSGPASALHFLRDGLPRGGLLPDDVWRRRHRAIVAILALHAAVIAVIVALRGFEPLHAIAEGGVVALAALAAANPKASRRARNVAASFGLL